MAHGSDTIFVIRHRVTDEREWEQNSGHSYRGWLLLLDGVASTFQGGKMLAEAHFLSDSVEHDEKAIEWEDKFGEMYGVVKDGGYVTEYLVEAKRIIKQIETKDTLNYQRAQHSAVVRGGL